LQRLPEPPLLLLLLQDIKFEGESDEELECRSVENGCASVA
jgi:hypothetical protein